MQSSSDRKSAKKGRALSDLQVDARACLQQNGDAAQVACIEHKACLNSMRDCAIKLIRDAQPERVEPLLICRPILASASMMMVM